MMRQLVVKAAFSLGVLLAAACTPTVQVQAPDKPIEINLNVRIEHEVRVKVDRDLDRRVFSNDSPLF